jgi:heterodisulfide reductase subunit C
LNFIGVIKKVTVCKISARYIYTDHQLKYENYKFSRRPVAKGVKRMRSLKKLKNFLTGGEAEKEEDENKSESEMSEIVEEEKKPVESETKQQTAPAVEEVKKEPVVEEKPSEVEVKTETIEEKPAIEEKPVVEEAEPVVEEETTIEEVEPVAEAETAVEENVEEPAAPKEAEVIEETKKDEPKPKGSGSMSLLNKEENLIRAEEVEPGFKQEIIDAGAETVALCYQCGTCTGSCPSGKRTPYRIRNIIRKSLMGLKTEVLNDETIWECVTCYACQERCPRGVAIVDVVKIIRNMQSKAGKMAQAHKMTGVFVLKTGHGVPINDATMALRKRVGLNELPPTTHEYPEALEEVRTILKKTGFDSLIGYNWETGEIE